MERSVMATGSKPMGLKGRMAGMIMNLIHTNQYRKIISRILEEIKARNEMKILDIGCGGGKAIKLFCALAENSKVYGIDHSSDMVILARKVNRTEVGKGQVEIKQGDVTNLPYKDNCFDIIAAFDTINFWTDFEKAMDEITRVLKENGMFLIVNGYPKEGTRWWGFVKFKDDDEYRKMLSEYGFGDIRIKIQKATITIQAYKNWH